MVSNVSLVTTVVVRNAMALPRWVMSCNVDSAAMKTAYCMWRQQNMEEAMAMGIEQGLTLIYHFPGLWEFPEPHFNNVSCPAGLHSWCMGMQGGDRWLYLSLVLEALARSIHQIGAARSMEARAARRLHSRRDVWA